MYIDASSVIAVALVLLVLVFIRISWTLKEISETLAARQGDANAVFAKERAEGKANAKAQEADEAADETEIAAVIAVANAVLHGAV